MSPVDPDPFSRATRAIKKGVQRHTPHPGRQATGTSGSDLISVDGSSCCSDATSSSQSGACCDPPAPPCAARVVSHKIISPGCIQTRPPDPSSSSGSPDSPNSSDLSASSHLRKEDKRGRHKESGRDSRRARHRPPRESRMVTTPNREDWDVDEASEWSRVHQCLSSQLLGSKESVWGTPAVPKGGGKHMNSDEKGPVPTVVVTHPPCPPCPPCPQGNEFSECQPLCSDAVAGVTIRTTCAPPPHCHAQPKHCTSSDLEFNSETRKAGRQYEEEERRRREEAEMRERIRSDIRQCIHDAVSAIAPPPRSPCRSSVVDRCGPLPPEHLAYSPRRRRSPPPYCRDRFYECESEEEEDCFLLIDRCGLEVGWLSVDRCGLQVHMNNHRGRRFCPPKPSRCRQQKRLLSYRSSGSSRCVEIPKSALKLSNMLCKVFEAAGVGGPCRGGRDESITVKADGGDRGRRGPLLVSTGPTEVVIEPGEVPKLVHGRRECIHAAEERERSCTLSPGRNLRAGRRRVPSRQAPIIRPSSPVRCSPPAAVRHTILHRDPSESPPRRVEGCSLSRSPTDRGYHAGNRVGFITQVKPKVWMQSIN
uniref:Uncharacterized protein n=1 Tax=Chromera velia CCMP2878 TaxID=1169474 RepID=A0A0G4I3S4_9ALVE|eukprot:Cvel_10747.t1-p1 / transcript=Cvel_10747.t1 / gene=Cvel_10747 / organism=Chromera_velia_CCMP2878 / gene_product=hypothetical protein / transcript_product=hypothetical protein / location=Cvel_scaffold655:62800-68841(+) / protein_length=590 / sequence_SO=supercontig / SO=protein_coding / is_pseudo=false